MSLGLKARDITGHYPLPVLSLALSLGASPGLRESEGSDEGVSGTEGLEAVLSKLRPGLGVSRPEERLGGWGSWKRPISQTAAIGHLEAINRVSITILCPHLRHALPPHPLYALLPIPTPYMLC